MKILDLPLFADENIHPQVVERLASEGLDIQTVFDAGLVGRDDTEILRAAHRSGRVVLSHDKQRGSRP